MPKSDIEDCSGWSTEYVPCRVFLYDSRKRIWGSDWLLKVLVSSVQIDLVNIWVIGYYVTHFHRTYPCSRPYPSTELRWINKIALNPDKCVTNIEFQDTLYFKDGKNQNLEDAHCYWNDHFGWVNSIVPKENDKWSKTWDPLVEWTCLINIRSECREKWNSTFSDCRDGKPTTKPRTSLQGHGRRVITSLS